MAASKCRLRKLERISVLDAQAQTLKSDNERLAALADKLREVKSNRFCSFVIENGTSKRIEP